TTGIPWPWPSDAAQRDHKQRGEQHAGQLHDLMIARKAQIQNHSEEPSKRELATTFANVAKPWKKPWDD
ncbi:MAG TPA: hypothetical protein VGO37_03700, partial [Steroidobacteraceae bacterium]|nr:hypothetical protein [Steroidobacteraceae bacterium]